jgi:type I restriction enzyme S subunit
MKLAPYPEYKDSGVPWLGKIPAHWELHRGKWLFRKMERPVRSQDEVVTCFRDGTVTLRKNRRIRGFTESLKEIGYQGIRKGDLVIHQMDAFAGAVGVSDSDGKGTPVYSVCLPKRDLDTHYYAQLVREMSRSYFITSLAKGIRERSTDFRFDTFASLTLPVPLPEEQKAISRFMRNESAQINKFIRNKRRFIELLKEQKQNVINQAVTRGLDPKVKFKPSGVEWIGDIPEHWDARRLKTIAKVVLGKMLKTSPSKDDQLKPYLRSANIQWFEANLSDVASMWFSQSEMEQYRISKNDILVSEGGEVGRACIWQDELEECYIQNSVHKVTAGAEVLPLFLLYQFSAFGSKGAFKAVVNRVSIAHLTREKLVAVFFCKPPIEEQKTILAHIQAKTAEIDQAIIRAQREIELMREYRTRLISDVVTGQVDVRNMKCEGGSLNEDEFEDIEEVEEEIELPEGGEDDE